MAKLRGLLSMLVAIAFVSLPGGGTRAQSPVFSSSMPLLGQPDPSANQSEFPGNPMGGGLSFDSLKRVLGALLKEQKLASRGAREIAIFRIAAPAVVLIKTSDGSGSGIILQTGMILTNRHVVEGVGNVQIFFKPDDLEKGITQAQTRSGTVRFVDRQRDLAIIAPESLPNGFKFLKISASDKFEVGADVYAIGHPLGYSWTFTQGIISGVRPIDEEGQRYTAVQTQTPINPGNSGGPLLNTDLEVIGINTWARDISTIKKEQVDGEDVTLVRPAQGLNFAVSARDLRAFLSDIDAGKISNLSLQLPPQGCSGQLLFNGRNKANDAGLKVFSLNCDNKADAWEIFPDERAQPVEYHLDPDLSGKSSIVVFSDSSRAKWATSLWDFFRDQTFAVKGYHEDGTIRPTRFEFSHTYRGRCRRIGSADRKRR